MTTSIVGGFCRVNCSQVYPTTMNAYQWPLWFKTYLQIPSLMQMTVSYYMAKLAFDKVFNFDLNKEKVTYFCDLWHIMCQGFKIFFPSEFKGKQNCRSRQKARPDQSCTLKPPFLSYSCFRILLLPLFPIIFFSGIWIAFSLTLRWLFFFFLPTDLKRWPNFLLF